MTSMRTLAVICGAVAVAGIILYVVAAHTYAGNETRLQNEKTTEKYHQAKVNVNGFEIMADIAMTSSQQEKGLSIKDSLNENEGMLFIFQKDDRYNFWMNGMKFPIDILWLDAAGKVVHIEPNLRPCVSENDCMDYASTQDARYVLETTAGFAERHNVEIGTDIDFQLIR